MRRVVVTAVGVVSAVGNDFETFGDALLSGRSGGGPVTAFPADGFPTRIAAEVEHVPDVPELASLAEIGDRKTLFGVLAARSAWQDGGRAAVEALEPSRIAVSLGTGLSSVVLGELEEDLVPYLDDGSIDFAAYGRELLEHGTFAPARHLTDAANRRVAALFGARGASLSHFSACAASLQSVGWGLQAIRRDRADVVIAGGQDSMVHPFGMISFMLLGALSQRNDDPTGACRPFDKSRDGFLMGEGAAVMVLEEREHALERGARIYGELVGYGTSVDGHNATAPDPEGAGAAAAMRSALADASLDPSAIGYMNAHGTGTQLNDPAEAKAISEVFGAHAGQVAVSSVKPIIGHTIAAAGALEVLTCLAALDKSRLPPNLNLSEPAPECTGLDLVEAGGRSAEVEYIMTNNYGFGGQNASLVIKRGADT